MKMEEANKNTEVNGTDKKLHISDVITRSSYLGRTWIVNDDGEISSNECEEETIQLINHNAEIWVTLPKDISQKIVDVLNGYNKENNIKSEDNTVIIQINGKGYIKEMMESIIESRITNFKGRYHLFVNGEEISSRDIR